MNQRTWEIYTLTDPRTNEVRYVGVTLRGKRRFNEHISRAITGGKTHRDCWIRSLIGLGIRPIYQVIEKGTGDKWKSAERKAIAKHRATCNLTNHTEGGEGTPGYVPSPELRAKWSKMRKGIKYPPGRVAAMKGKHHTAEAREKIRLAGTGRRHREEAKRKLSLAHKGKVLTKDHRVKLGKAKQGKKHTPEHNAKIALATKGRKPVLCVETGQKYASITAAARALNVNEASVYQAMKKGCCCKGQHYNRL